MAKALWIPLNKESVPIEVNGLADLQRYVGGYIEAIGWYFDNQPTLYCNDEGKLGLQPNRALYATKAHEDAGYISLNTGKPVKEGEVLDIVYGNMIAVGFDPETGEDRDISPEEADLVCKTFGGDAIDSGFIEALRAQIASRRGR